MTLTLFAERDARSGLWQYRCLLAARSFSGSARYLAPREVRSFSGSARYLARLEVRLFQALLDSFYVERPVSFQALLFSSARAESNTSSRVLRYYWLSSFPDVKAF